MGSQGANAGWPAASTGGGDLVQSYYETLLRSDEKGNLIPWLAESYKVADDQKSITFTLRKGAKFSDGSDLTTDVVKWNLDQRIKSQPSWTSVEVVDPNTVRVNFKTWDNSLPASSGDGLRDALDPRLRGSI
jgi:peptide/nickel transport system substrate-binding protein